MCRFTSSAHGSETPKLLRANTTYKSPRSISKWLNRKALCQALWTMQDMGGQTRPRSTKTPGKPRVLVKATTPKGSRTPVLWLRTRYPRPLDDGGVDHFGSFVPGRCK